jgi:hypothetical protein
LASQQSRQRHLCRRRHASGRLPRYRRLMAEGDLTGATDAYPAEAVASALTKISPQGLWLLLSLDHYGWRAEYDLIGHLLTKEEEGHGHSAEHAPYLAQLAPALSGALAAVADYEP